jgi:hypothetical protein
MSELSHEEKFIIEKLKEKEGKINYKDLQILCQDEFEGVRLILKKLKEILLNSKEKFLDFPLKLC